MNAQDWLIGAGFGLIGFAVVNSQELGVDPSAMSLKPDPSLTRAPVTQLRPSPINASEPNNDERGSGRWASVAPSQVETPTPSIDWVALRDQLLTPEDRQRHDIPNIVATCNPPGYDHYEWWGLYDSQQNLILVCPQRGERQASLADITYVIAHELGHWRQERHQDSGLPATSTQAREFDADYQAANQLAAIGDCDALRQAASYPWPADSVYLPGQRYVRQVYEQQCNQASNYR